MALRSIAERFKLKEYSYWYVLLLFLIFFILIPITELGGNSLLNYNSSQGEATIIIVLAKVVFAFITTFIIFKFTNIFFQKIGLEKIHFLKWNKKTLKTFFLSTGIIFFILLSSGLYLYLTTKDSRYLKLFLLTSLSQIIYNLSPAFMEEFIFRGFVLNFFKQKKSKYLGLVITSSFFGLLHLLNFFVGNPISWLEVLSITAGGFFLGLMYLNFGLFASIVVHYFWNISQVDFEGDIFSTCMLILVCILLSRRLNKISVKPAI